MVLLLVVSLIITFGLGLILGPENPYMQFDCGRDHRSGGSLTHGDPGGHVDLCQYSSPAPSCGCDECAVPGCCRDFSDCDHADAIRGRSSRLQDFILRVAGMFSRGGARGLLIGIALGTLLTGLRVLFGVDRPYGGN